MFTIYNECSIIILIGVLLNVPLPSIQHFIWPLSWCLLADYCNHTWIPECGDENKTKRLFIDECDMFEYNCDHERDFEIVNYSDCFRAVQCPTTQKCPSHPTCKNHNLHRMGDRYIVLNPERRFIHRRRREPPVSLPMSMLKGKRRYTPEVLRRQMRERKHQQIKATATSRRTTKQTTWRTSQRISRDKSLRKRRRPTRMQRTALQTTERTTQLQTSLMKSPVIDTTEKNIILRREIVYKNVTLLILRPTIQHFSSPTTDSCILAIYCNHTAVPTCGQDKYVSEIRLFLDECDMFEHNCDHKKAFTQIDCPQNIIEGQTDNLLTELASAFSQELTKSKQVTNVTSAAITVPINCTCGHATTILTTSNSNTMTTTSTTTTPDSITITPLSTTTTLTKTTPTTIIATATTATETIALPTTPLPNILTTTCTRKLAAISKSITTSTVTTTLPNAILPNTTVFMTTASTTRNLTSVQSAVTTENTTMIKFTGIDATPMIQTNKSDVNSTLAHEEINHKINETTSSVSVKCSNRAKNCFVPRTWETTAEGERRDFFQILRSRYGTGVKNLSATNNSPSFAGRHNDRG